jgi:hypothetical protein
MKIPKKSKGCEDCANEVCPYVYPLKHCPRFVKKGAEVDEYD